MGHSVDLSKYKIRTDLALDIVDGNKIEGIKTDFHNYGEIKVTNVTVDKIGSEKINKKPGVYITIEYNDVTDTDNYHKVCKAFSKELKQLLDKLNITKDDMCLVIGLGNATSTPDALGPLTIDEVIPTNHLYVLGELDPKYRRVCTFAPGVTGSSGIETSDAIKSMVKTVNPDFVIVIDSLASQSISRVNKTIQMTDAGIEPGSGVGNSRKEISATILNIPVIAIGIPTVVDAVTIVSDTINYMYRHYSYALENKDDPLNKLRIGSPNYLNKPVKENNINKHHLFGLIGDLNYTETKQLIYEVLSPIGYNLMVTPKEIDFVITKLGKLIAEGINISLHNT